MRDPGARRTGAVLVLSALGLGLWELWTLVSPSRRDTISRVMRDSGQRYPILPFMVGLLVGHFWWRVGDEPE